MFLKHLIEYAGLSENEAKVYLVALGLGKVLASTIARKAGINRASIYSITSNLIQKGLMGMTVINNINYFYAGDPSALLSAKSNELENQQSQLKHLSLILPELQLLRKKSEENQSHLYTYHGLDALSKLYERITSVKNTDLYTISRSNSCNKSELALSKEFDMKRIANNIFHRVIVTSKESLTDQSFCNELLEKRHVALSNNYSSDSIIHLHENKIIFISDKPQSEAIVLENKSCFDFMMDIFNYFWCSARH